MPELPEVESVRRQLDPELRGRRIVDVWWDAHPAARIGGLPDAVGCRIVGVRRRGKFLLVDLEAGPTVPPRELVLHLGMTGWLRVLPIGASRDAHDRVAAHLDDGRTLAMRDPRRFGRATVVDAGRYLPGIPTLALLGPEPLTAAFEPAGFAAALTRSHASVKALLLGQRLVAGVGNIYADEALWRAGIHPASRRVGRARAHTLHAALRDVLAAAIEREGTSFRDYRLLDGEPGRYADQLDVYGRAGLPCRRCGAALRRSVVAQRTTVHCPRCQR